MEESPYSAPQSELRQKDSASDSRVDDTDLDPVAFIAKLYQMNYGEWTITKKAAERGISEEFTATVIEQIHQAKLAAIRRAGLTRLICGGLVFLSGIVYTVYSMSQEGQGRFAWGAIVFGGLIAAQGFMHLRSPMPSRDE